MKDKEPIFNSSNFYIMLNAAFGLLPLLLLPYIMLSLSILVIVVLEDFQKAGGIIAVLGAAYTFAQEFYVPDAHAMANEIHNDPSIMKLRQRPDSAHAMILCDAVLKFSATRHRFVARLVETLMIVGGGLYALFGDKL